MVMWGNNMNQPKNTKKKKIAAHTRKSKILPQQIENFVKYNQFKLHLATNCATLLSKQNYTLRTKNEVCANSLLLQYTCMVPFKSGAHKTTQGIFTENDYIYSKILNLFTPLYYKFYYYSYLQIDRQRELLVTTTTTTGCASCIYYTHLLYCIFNI